jgi:hypothetical protein
MGLQGPGQEEGRSATDLGQGFLFGHLCSLTIIQRHLAPMHGWEAWMEATPGWL